MMFKKALLLGLALIAVLGGVYAYTIFNSVIVNVNGPCIENDGGLNFNVQGFVFGNFWWTYQNQTVNYNGTFYDACLNNFTLVEGVCGSSLAGNFSNLAAIAYVDCRSGNVTNGTTRGLCVSGRCI